MKINSEIQEYDKSKEVVVFWCLSAALFLFLMGMHYLYVKRDIDIALFAISLPAFVVLAVSGKESLIVFALFLYAILISLLHTVFRVARKKVYTIGQLVVCLVIVVFHLITYIYIQDAYSKIAKEMISIYTSNESQ